MPSLPPLLQFICDADVFDLDKLELYADVPADLIAKAIEREDVLTIQQLWKLEWFLKSIGINF